STPWQASTPHAWRVVRARPASRTFRTGESYAPDRRVVHSGRSRSYDSRVLSVRLASPGDTTRVSSAYDSRVLSVRLASPWDTTRGFWEYDSRAWAASASVANG